MFKSLTDSLRSLWSTSTDAFDREQTGRKRKHNGTEGPEESENEDNDPDVQIIKVEKRRRLDDHSSSLAEYFRNSVTKMAEWIRPKPKVFSEDFRIRTKNRVSHSGRATVTQENGGHGSVNRVPWMNGEGKVGRVTETHKNLSRFNEVGKAKTSSSPRESNLNASFTRRSSESSNFGFSKRSTANESVRLKEREQYQQLLQLQSQRSPWQPRVPMNVPGGSTASLYARDEHRDTHTLSESSNDSRFLKSHVEVSELLRMNAMSSLLSKQRYKASLMSQPSANAGSAVSSIVGNAASSIVGSEVSNCSSVVPQRQQHRQYLPSAGALASAASPTRGFKARRSISNRGDLSERREEKTNDVTLIKDGETGVADQRSLPANRVPDTIVIDDVEEVEAESRVPPVNASKQEVMDRFSKETRISQSCYERCQAHLQEKERRRREIEEEEIKAKAYEEKRRLQNLSLERQMKYQMRIFDELPEVPQEIFVDYEEEEESLPELSDEQMDRVRAALRPGNPNEVLSEAFRLQITRRDMATLAGLNWLNDEVINFYMNMLMERGEQEGWAKVYAFNTFFYPKIMSGGHSAVRRWTKKVDIFSVHFIIIPVHLGMHWCLCIVDIQEKKVKYYDSMGAANNNCLRAVLNYINDESVAKKQTPINKSEWEVINIDDNPQQMNGSDCGMFMCKYAEYITRQKEITFKQEDMPYFRQRMVYEIVSKKLLQ